MKVYLKDCLHFAVFWSAGAMVEMAITNQWNGRSILGSMLGLAVGLVCTAFLRWRKGMKS